MQNKQNYALKYIIKNKINVFICYFSDIYSTDAATFVLLVIMLTMIKNEEVKDNY